MLTIFTPTYNRAHTLPRLFESLKAQTCNDFEWLVIDDGSSDDTNLVISNFCDEPTKFPIRYYKTENCGKNRAINTALDLALGEYFLILDSDDLLKPTAVNSYLNSFSEIHDDKIIGVSMLRGDLSGRSLNSKAIFPSKGYIDCSNIERNKFNLGRDMAECFRIDILRKYKFEVWPTEKFTPEAVVWDRIALDGYKLRWYNKVEYLCEYMDDGLTKNSVKLIKNNPMGYSMLYNIKMEYESKFKNKIILAVEYDICCILANEWSQIENCYNKFFAFLVLPHAILKSFIRYRRFSKID